MPLALLFSGYRDPLKKVGPGPIVVCNNFQEGFGHYKDQSTLFKSSLRSWRDSRPSARALFRANGREREPRSREGIGISVGCEKKEAKPPCVSGEAAFRKRRSRERHSRE